MKLIKKMKNKKGFTLIELLVVLVIIGVIVALILPNTLNAINRANDKECASNIRTINTAMQLCYTQTRDWTACDTIAKLQVIPAGFNEASLGSGIPTCPFGDPYVIPVAPNAGTGTDVSTGVGQHFDPWPPRTEPHL